MLKSYNEMRKVDVSAFTEDRDGMKYLNWAKCVDLLHQHGAEKVYFQPIVNEKGSSLFMTEKEFIDKNKVVNQCYEVGVHIVIDDLEFDMRGPLMNASNPVKDNSMSQQRIWNCQTRLFVKGVAIHTGLGFDLWLKEEMQSNDSKYDDPYSHSLAAIKERIEQRITSLLDLGWTLNEIATKCNAGTDEDVRDLLRHFAKIDRFEKALGNLK